MLAERKLLMPICFSLSRSASLGDNDNVRKKFQN